MYELPQPAQGLTKPLRSIMECPSWEMIPLNDVDEEDIWVGGLSFKGRFYPLMLLAGAQPNCELSSKPAVAAAVRTALQEVTTSQTQIPASDSIPKRGGASSNMGDPTSLVPLVGHGFYTRTPQVKLNQRGKIM